MAQQVIPATVLGSTWVPMGTRGQRMPEKQRVQIPRAWSQPVPPARCIPAIPAQVATSEGSRAAQSASPRRLVSRAEDARRCTRQLQVIKEALRSWPSDSTDLALQEAIDFARRASNLQPGEPWGAQEVRSFGLRMMATHGLEAVDWPAGQWLSMLHIVDVPLPGRNSDRVSVDPLGREDAARLGKMAFQMLQAQLEQEMRRLGSSESSTTVLSPSQGSNASTSGTWQPQLPQIGPAGPYVQIVSNGQPGRRLKASPRHGERNMVRSHSEAPPAQPAVPMMRAVPASGLAGIELQLAQLKQEIVQERQERQALARLVETLIKDRPDRKSVV